MKPIFLRRIPAALLSVLLAVSLLFTGAAAEASTGLLHFGPKELAAASDQVSPYTPEIVGMSMAPGGSGWYMLYGLNMNYFTPDGVPIVMSGDEITFVVHAYAPDEQPSDMFLQLDIFNNSVQFIENITPSAYEEAEEKYCEEYDYYYKELSLSWTAADDFDQKVYEDTSLAYWQMRVRGFNTVTTNLYYLAILINGQVYYECDGDLIYHSLHENGNWVSAVEAPASAEPIAVRAGKAENPDGYSNLILDNLGRELAAGNYNATITFSNRSADTTPFDPDDDEATHTFGDKLLSVSLSGAGDPITVDYTKRDLLTNLNIASCTAFDCITMPFTLEADGRVELDVTHYGVYDLLISDITIERALTPEERDAAAVNEAIAAIGTVTEENYEAAGPRIEKAETAYADFVSDYGQEKADRMITGVESMKAARAEYDRIAATKPQAAVQAAIDAIDAIGSPDSINESNYKSVRKQVIIAGRMVQNLVDTFGEEILSNVSNYSNIQAAQDKISAILAEESKPAYILGRVNDDDKIDASDALMVLQHSVYLITLTDPNLSAADVDASGAVDASDALYILQYSVELIEQFPADQADTDSDVLEPDPRPANGGRFTKYDTRNRQPLSCKRRRRHQRPRRHSGRHRRHVGRRRGNGRPHRRQNLCYRQPLYEKRRRALL